MSPIQPQPSRKMMPNDTDAVRKFRLGKGDFSKVSFLLDNIILDLSGCRSLTDLSHLAGLSGLTSLD